MDPFASHQDPDVSMGNVPEDIEGFARQHGVEKSQLPIPSDSKAGLLSQTVVPSPTVQWILPARLRSQRHNDVVFVGDRHLQIREFVAGIHLEDITSKSDFDAQIMAAKVVNVSTELPWEAQMKMGSGNIAANANLEAQGDLAPQILVLSLASRELAFLYYSTSGEGRFVHYRRPLPSGVNLFEQYGRNIAVDPRSRAIAISPSCDYFGILLLKEPHVLQSQMAQDYLDPIIEEHFFCVDGDILFMEFLYPRSENEDKLILLLLVAQKQTTNAISFEWDASTPLRNSSPRVTKITLPLEVTLPTMVIPLTKDSAFIIITSQQILLFNNKLDNRDRGPIRHPLSGREKQAGRSPLWIRWARPLRTWKYSQNHDDIYLCCENGEVSYLEIGNSGDDMLQVSLGLLGCDVDAAFDTLDIGHDGGDLLLAAGNMGGGGLFVQKARESPLCVQKFMNWAPVTDSVILQSTDHGFMAADVARDRLFVCSASTSGKGAITELRHGIEAQIGLAVSLEELSSTRDLWTMTDNVNGGVFILTSDPVSSLLIYLPADFGEEISAIDEVDSGLSFSSQTLAAGYTPSGSIIQVTERGIYLGVVAGSPSGAHLDYDFAESVAAAAIDETAGLVATALRTHQGSYIHLMKIISTDGKLNISEVGKRTEIDGEPVSISVANYGFSSFVFIGTGSGKLLVYRVAEERTTFLTDVNVDVNKGDDISKAIDSLASVHLATNGSVARSTIFCGLRSGTLFALSITVDINNSDPIDIKHGIPQRLGHTSAKVQSKGNVVLLTCGETFWQVSCVEDGELPEYTLQRIWITDQNNPAYYPKSIHGFATSNVVSLSMDNTFNSLFCIADEQLLICTLGREARAVPRRIDLPGSAGKLAYSKHLKSLIVSYTQTELDTNHESVWRYKRPIIDFVDPDIQNPVVSSPGAESGPQAWRPRGAAGEKITCILEWTPRRGDEEYHLIVIGTSRKNQQDRGRVIFLQAARDASDPSRVECSVKYVHKLEGPVRSVTPFGPFTLMVASGNEIVPLEPKFSRTRWGRASRYSLMSPAISMTAHEPYLYMSLARELLMVLKASDDKLTLHGYDRHTRDGLSHVHIGGPLHLTLASSRGGNVILQTGNGINETDKMIPAPLCEAHLPQSVMQLCLGSKHSPLSASSRLVYGTAINGTTYRFMTLNEKEWRLLRLLQNLCVKDPRLCPFTSKRKQQRDPVESETVDTSPSRMHINGDILSRLVARGAEYLERMLVSGELYDASVPDSGNAQATMERFSQLSVDLFGERPNPAGIVMKWLRGALHVQF